MWEVEVVIGNERINSASIRFQFAGFKILLDFYYRLTVYRNRFLVNKTNRLRIIHQVQIPCD
jgi:hypothetical protein